MAVPIEMWSKISERYEVSNFGNVRSVDRVSHDKSKRKLIVQGKILAHGIRSDGYHVVNITGFRHKKNWKVHQLVAFAFIPNPNNYPVVNHKNGNKDDNSADNIEWCTQQYNCLHAFCVLKRKPVVNCGSKNGFSKIIIDITTGIFYDCITDAANALNIKRRTLNAMIIGQNKNRTNLIYA
jgi:hypothetical protein